MNDSVRLLSSSIALITLAACGPKPPAEDAATPAPSSQIQPGERHFADLVQLTFGGENAEAYWSFGGDELILQARLGDAQCDRIYRMPLSDVLPLGTPPTKPPTLTPVSSGAGATTCAYFLPGDDRVIYASTHLASPECPPKPDHSQGYVWPLYAGYDIFSTAADGSDIKQLTTEEGYDAEGTVCPKDGSIVFTSMRDGDLELYRMDKDGGNVKRLTNAVGYDGGAFFNPTCDKIVWRASRPLGQEKADYQALLKQGLVRPSKLELWVAGADGSDARQITWLDAASFGPSWFPNRDRIIFSTNYGDPKGREFDLWAIDADGTDLERITYSAGFDGFPLFSPDGKTLAFASNRATAEGAHDTNVFLARWVDEPITTTPTAADRVMSDAAWLADPAREGRGLGTAGLAAAGDWLTTRMQTLGLQAGGDAGGFKQPFKAVTGLERGAATQVSLGGVTLAPEDYVVMGHSPHAAQVKAPIVAAGYGIAAPELGHDDYAKRNVRGKVVLVRRFVPEGAAFAAPEAERRYGDIRYKAWSAREHGAVALIVVDDPAPPVPAVKGWKAPAEAALPTLRAEGYSDAGLPVIVVKRAKAQPLRAALEAGRAAAAELVVALEPITSDAFNVVGRIVGTKEPKLPGALVIGAHYDHLGLGGHGSLVPGTQAPHLGADDNASGTAALLEAARALMERRGELQRDVIVAAFSGEESGLLGSAHFVRQWPEQGDAGKVNGITAMVNLDMVGRMRDGRVQVLGAGSSKVWPELVGAACANLKIDCGDPIDSGSDGYGPSDQTSFYAAGVPVLHLFTGAHSDYHKPSDSADKLNAGGIAAIAALLEQIVHATAAASAIPVEVGAAGPVARGDRRSFNASLGTIPNYAGPGDGKGGVLLDGVRPGSAAEQAGMRRGDVIVKLGQSVIGSVEDLMFVLTTSKPGETVAAAVVRNGQTLTLKVTFQEGRRRTTR